MHNPSRILAATQMHFARACEERLRGAQPAESVCNSQGRDLASGPVCVDGDQGVTVESGADDGDGEPLPLDPVGSTAQDRADGGSIGAASVPAVQVLFR